MINESFDQVWRQATGYPEPFPYQRRIAMENWPDILAVPTGLGKTAAVGLAWIYRRMTACPETPRRLIYCLPMRVLAEQTRDEFSSWLSNLELLGEPGEGKVSVSLLMGGEVGLRQAPWALYPEENAVLIGTQDMLLSRALMRGYGMSRYQWPVHFALLHSDALWIFDEVQLMGPALLTSAQLDAFRRRFPRRNRSRSLWVSATLHEEWLSTVDFCQYLPTLEKIEISEADVRLTDARLNAVKRIHRADVVLDRETAKASAKEYVRQLADAVLKRHKEGEQTLVILNRVDRAQSLARHLDSVQEKIPILLVHARFRSAERELINEALRSGAGPDGRIIVATQAVEAGIDMSSRTLFTELAPWASMVQRFGRCNRFGEHIEGADIHWIDITDDANESPPYADTDLRAARKNMERLAAASPSALPPVSGERAPGQVLRWKDLIDLFDTDPDLSGFDIDIAPYIRDQGTPQVQTFWRVFEGEPSDEPSPTWGELCPVSMGQISTYLKKKVKRRARSCWIWDPLLGRWEKRQRQRRVVPGSILLLQATDGGYDSFLGFVPSTTTPVSVVHSLSEPTENETYADDSSTYIGRFVNLTEHVTHVAQKTNDLAAVLQLEEPDATALDTAARWHDVGKAHPAFQTALLDFAEDRETRRSTLWAKSSGSGRLRFRIEDNDGVQPRPHFRHELASMLAWLSNPEQGEDVDLVAFLIAAHHGKVRMGLRALPTEPIPPGDQLFARGVWDGDSLPPMRLNGIELPTTTLRLEVMRLGRSEFGPSWTERTRRLLDAHGPFGLAWKEALLRIADSRASAAEEQEHA